MTIVMTEKHQVTIPKKIASAMGLAKGSLFDVHVNRNRIELVPLEASEKHFTEEQYHKLDALSAREKGKEKKVTHRLIHRLKNGQA